jgi:hypothetical protein
MKWVSFEFSQPEQLPQSLQSRQSLQFVQLSQAPVNEHEEQSSQSDTHDEQLDTVFEQAAEAVKDKRKILSSTKGITCFVRMYNTDF